MSYHNFLNEGYLWLGEGQSLHIIGNKTLPGKLLQAAAKTLARIQQHAPADLEKINVYLRQITMENSFLVASVEWTPMGYNLNIIPRAVENFSEMTLMGLFSHEFGHIVAGHCQTPLPDDLPEPERKRISDEMEAEADTYPPGWGLAFERQLVPRFRPAGSVFR